MSKRRICEMPSVPIRKSTFELENLMSKLSSINTEESGIYNEFAEALLCLANEIKEIKKESTK